MSFHQPENPFPLARMKNFIEKDVSTRRKNYWEESLKSGGRKMVSTSQKISVVFSKIKLFLWKLFTPNSDNAFY